MASASPRQNESKSGSASNESKSSKAVEQGEAARRAEAGGGAESAGEGPEAEEIAVPPSEPEKGKLRFEGYLPRDEAASYFEAVVDGLRKGTIQFKQNEDRLTLSPTEHVDIELKVARKDGREKVSLELEWRTSDEPHLEIVAG